MVTSSKQTGAYQYWCSKKLKAHANGRNKSQHCCVLLRGFWPAMLRPFACAYTQQVPTLLWFHANGRNMLGPTMLRPFAWAPRDCALKSNLIATGTQLQFRCDKRRP